jgi:curli biogenesis system outer membrane secretion channel CsgG
MVETAVETSNKFRVIERRQLGNLVNEQAMGNSGMVTTNTPGQRGV